MKRRAVLKYLAATATAALGPGFSLSESLPSPSPASAPVLQGVYFNQLGFQPSRAKIATIVNPGETAFRIRNEANGKIVFKGTLTPPATDEASGDSVCQADFSALRKHGTYRIEIGNALSDPFPIRQDVYANALYLTMRSYYGQRCGCAVDLGNGYRHAACHTDGAYHASSGKAAGTTPATMAATS